jgi:hypothetical protein
MKLVGLWYLFASLVPASTFKDRMLVNQLEMMFLSGTPSKGGQWLSSLAGDRQYLESRYLGARHIFMVGDLDEMWFKGGIKGFANKRSYINTVETLGSQHPYVVWIRCETSFVIRERISVHLNRAQKILFPLLNHVRGKTYQTMYLFGSLILQGLSIDKQLYRHHIHGIYRVVELLDLGKVPRTRLIFDLFRILLICSSTDRMHSIHQLPAWASSMTGILAELHKLDGASPDEAAFKADVTRHVAMCFTSDALV